MFEYFRILSDTILGDENAVFHLLNSVFLSVLCVTCFFIYILMSQKDLDQFDYTTETVDGQPVNVLYSSNWTDTLLPVIMVIPGNPGQGGFYVEYLDMLVEEGHGKFRGCVVSHVGHSPSQGRVFNVREQIQSKISFIKEQLNPGTKIYLVGHSFGAYIVLQMLQKGVKVKKSALLFPMFDNMAEMPKAGNLNRMLQFQFYITAISWLTSLLPHQLRHRMIQFYLNRFSKNTQDHMANTIFELIAPSSLSNIFGLARNELALIREPDFSLIKKHQDNLVFYYGMFDLWAPLDCLRKLRKHVPGVKFHIADSDVSHTFMFGSCRKVAVKTIQFLTDDLPYDMTNLLPNIDEVRAAAAAAVSREEGKGTGSGSGSSGPELQDYDFCEDDE